MRVRRPLGVRVHLLVAMVAIALTSVAVSGVLITRSVEREMDDFARRDLRFSALTAAEMASAVYLEAGHWSAPAVHALDTVARTHGDAFRLLDADGTPVAGPAAHPAAVGEVREPVIVRGRRVGTVVASHPSGAGGAAERLTRHLVGRMDDLLLEAGALAVLLALAAAMVVALRMARPLHRLTEVARRMEAGEIEIRASAPGGSREVTRLAHTIDRLATALRRQDELRRETIDDVTHELRGSLVGVIAGVETLEDRIDAGEPVLAQMKGHAERLHRLVDDVDRLAEAQRPGLLVRRRPIDLGAVARAAAAGYAERCRARGITLTHRIATARVDADPERLAQVLDNLLSNALRYTDAGGRVAVGLSVRDGAAIIEVADTGIGIAPEHLPRVFDRFWRAPQARGRVADGSGIGLALVTDLVGAHGGRVEADSEPGRGSRFRVVLPLSHEPVAASDVRDPATERCATRRRPLREPADPRISIEPSSPRAGLLHLGP